MPEPVATAILATPPVETAAIAESGANSVVNEETWLPLLL
jgi:hypothetical protein